MSNAIYRGALASALNAQSAWKTALIIVAGLALAISVAYIKAKGVQRVVLVPYGMISANNAVHVTGTPAEDGEYLDLLFRADFSILLNWTPKTVGKQMDLFMTRLTPNAYASFNLGLRENARVYSETNITEFFHPESVALLDHDPSDSAVILEVKGSLKRTQGATQILNEVAVYRFTYVTLPNGLYAIEHFEVDSREAELNKR